MADFDLTAEIKTTLAQYSEQVRVNVEKAASTCASELRKDLERTSPKRTGRYRGSWKVRKEKVPMGEVAFTIHNQERYMLTSLLEKGHRKRGGSGSVRAIPHIRPAEERWVKEFEKKVEEALKV